MKNLVLIISITILFSLSACGQKKDEVPENVKTAFNQKFPNATKVKWGKENSSEWEAEFKMDGMEYSANFNNDANWLETEYEIEVNDLPELVKSTIVKEFKDYKIKESEISETAEGKVYEFEIKKGEERLEVAIDKEGKVVKKEQLNDEDDED